MAHLLYGPEDMAHNPPPLKEFLDPPLFIDSHELLVYITIYLPNRIFTKGFLFL